MPNPNALYLVTNPTTWSYTLHDKDLKTCDRCHLSTRNPCIQCDHSLSGQIYTLPDGEVCTTCEVCGTQQNYIGGYA